MPVTYKKIASVTVGAGGSASMAFTSIPSTYTDLILKVSVREESTNSYELAMDVNGLTTAIYNWRLLQGSGSSAISDQRTSQTIGQAGVLSSSNSTASTFGNIEIYFPNYSGSTNKCYSVDSVGENNGTLAYARLVAGLISTTSAITSITLKLGSGDLDQYSTAVLYGISKS